MNDEELLAGVQACVAEALDVPAITAVPGARLIGDLGADSLDLLDLVFQLERRFEIKLSMKDLENRMNANLGEGPAEVDGVFTPAALECIRQAMSEVPPEELSEGLRVAELPRRFRVSTLMRWVSQALEAQHV